MNEIKRGFFQDHYKNGEPKTFETQEDEKLYGAMTGFVLCILFAGGFVAYVIFCV